MTIDPRDAIWNETHTLLYYTSYAEGIEKALLARWTWVDSISKIAVAISSGSAALTGLVFWKNNDYTFLWPLFTSASTLLAIVSRQLSVADKLKGHATSAAGLSALGISIGSLIVRMKINSEFPVAEFEKKLLGFRDKYSVEYGRLLHDLLLTEALRVKVQQNLNAVLSSAPR
jgi:hypothetical protein